MSVASNRPKSATLDELLSNEFYKRLVASATNVLPEMKSVKSPEQVINSNFAKEIVEIYKILFLGSFNKLDMASLEHSDYLSHLLPCLSMDSFPLIANLDSKSQEVFKKTRFSTVMTCVWCFVELHSSGRSEYVDVLSNLSSKYKNSFESLFSNAAQFLMLESWKEDLCESRDFDNVDRVTVLEQRALLRFFIICFQRIELFDVRRCCMSLLSPQVWMHIPEDLLEANFFKNNKVSKALFLKALENYKIKHKACKFESLLSDPDSKVDKLYELVPNNENIDLLTLSYRLVLSRDFMNSLVNQFVYILEDYLYFSDFTKTDKELLKEDGDMMKLMYIENYLELFIDLLSQLHLRRIIKPLIEYKLLLVRCKNHTLYEPSEKRENPKNNEKSTNEDANIFMELVNILDYYLNFNINEELGVEMEYNVILEEYYKRFNKFQRVCYLNYKDDENLKNIHLVNNYSLNNNLSNILSSLNLNILIRLNQELHLIPSSKENSDEKKNLNGKGSDYLWPYTLELIPKKKKPKKLVKKLLISNLTNYLKKPINETMLINNNNFYLNPFSSLFSNATTVSTNSLIQAREGNRRELTELAEVEEDMSYIKLCTLSLFKLNLQYLTLFDYLYRNFILYQFEIIYQIKQYVHQQIFYLSYLTAHSKKLTNQDSPRNEMMERREWVGRMFICIDNLDMKITGKRVEMMLTVDLSLVQDYKIRQEWQQLTKYDILYLVQLTNVCYHNPSTTDEDTEENDLWGKGVKRIRFGEILEVYDEEDNNVLDYNPLDNKSFVGFKMRVKLLLDYQQYMKDIQEDLEYYSSFNLLIRRSKRQNNFKSILTNVQSIINHKYNIPNWLQIILLGYFSYNSTRPKTSNTTNIPDFNSSHSTDRDEIVKKRRKERTRVTVGMDYLNTFRDKEHLLTTTSSIPVKLVPTVDFTTNNRSTSVSSNQSFCHENRIYIDALDDSLNSYAYTNRDKFNKKEFSDKLKVYLESNHNVNLFVQTHLPSTDTLNSGNEKSKNKDNILLNGLEFELYIEDSYLGELTKSGNNYLINNEPPRFLITNFNHPHNDNPEHGVDKEDRRNVKFVNRQVESILKGTMEGLTVIMGPPGTGKTDVVSQIISILFNNFENEKIVICTHSNFALNDIFTKLVKNELIDEHYMVRLGHSDLEVDDMGHFSKFGRVNYILQRRLDLLDLVKTIKDQIGVTGDYECTIQYSLTFLQYFFLNKSPYSSLTNGESNVNGTDGVDELLERDKRLESGLDNFFKLEIEFPYTLKDMKKLYHQIQQFSDETGLLEHKDLKKKFVEKLYEMLYELLPFEVLRNNRDRMKYLVENYSRIVAMTCTHASIAQEELSTLNYKSLIFEEAAQVLEIESFIPICNNVKRLILCGDHLQLSPIIQNTSLLKYSNLNQSLFLRLIRLNYPYVQLNTQARSRPEILNVYSHFYPHKIHTLEGLYPQLSDQQTETLGHLNLNQMLGNNEFKQRIHEGGLEIDLKYVVQFLDVKGEETSPIKYFYQNLEEANYCVSLYMLMRLIGLKDIVILTAYNGQKCLIEDIVKKRCSWNNKIGSPFVSTIDKFQGRQSDYVIVSMVRTKNIGYLRDPRRFVVATSRSKLGLYVVGCKKLVQNIKELSKFNEQLNLYPNELYLKLTDLKNKDDERVVKLNNNQDLERLLMELS